MLSIFDFNEETWTVTELNQIGLKILKFIHSPFISNTDGDLIILGSEGSRAIQKFDMNNYNFSSMGRLPGDDNFNESTKSRDIISKDGKLYCLSHKSKMRMYRGDLASGRWELV